MALSLFDAGTTSFSKPARRGNLAIERYNLLISWELHSNEAAESFSKRLESLGEAVAIHTNLAFVHSRLPFDDASALLHEAAQH